MNYPFFTDIESINVQSIDRNVFNNFSFIYDLHIVYKIIYTFFEIYNKSIISNRDGKILARDRLGG